MIHYWNYRLAPEENLLKAIEAANLVLTASPNLIAGLGGRKSFRLNKTVIEFNSPSGVGETFTFSLTGRGSCDTKGEPYELVVTAVLCALASELGSDLDVTSDVTSDAWAAGLQLAKTTAGDGISLPPGIVEAV